MTPSRSSFVQAVETPLVIFGYKRPEKMSLLVESIRSAGISFKRIYVFIDGPKGSNSMEDRLVRDTQKVATKLKSACGELSVVRNERNLGLKTQVLTQLDILFERHTCLIVLEDDCVPSSTFFPFAESMLKLYEDSEEVYRIGGFLPPGVQLESSFSYSFVVNSGVWGWATWANKWKKVRPEIDSFHYSWKTLFDLLSDMPGIFKKVQYANTFLRNKSLDSWAVPFTAVLRLRKKLGIVPAVCLVENVGFSEDATHTKRLDPSSIAHRQELEFPLNHPDEVERNRELERRFSRAAFKAWFMAIVRGRTYV